MTIELVAGALLLAGFFVPVALCVVMPVSTCAVYWSVILEHQPAGAALALVAFALNGAADAGLHRLLQGRAAALRACARRSVRSDV